MKNYFPLIFLPILISACAPVYFPNQLQTPLLKEKNEATVSISTGTSNFDVQAAFSPIKHMDLLFDLSAANLSDHEHLQIEGGLGYYNTLNEVIHVEFLGGGGAGYSKTTTQGTLGEHNEGMFSRFYLQPNVFLISEYAELGLATRLAFINFREYGLGSYLEPTLVGRFGLENIKFQVQAGLSYNINDNVELDYNPLIFNLGLVYTFRKKTKE